jgi:hypothetical protein
MSRLCGGCEIGVLRRRRFASGVADVTERRRGKVINIDRLKANVTQDIEI